MKHRAWGIWVALLGCLCLPSSIAAASGALNFDAGRAHGNVRSAHRLADGGLAALISEEDREVIENMELLEHIDESKDLELLLELSKGRD